MKLLALTRGKFAKVDDVDFSAVSAFKWYANETKPGKFYARRMDGVYLHRLITGAPRGVQVDHKNGDSLDCRRRNLRACTNQENASAHRSQYRGGNKTSPFRGVSWYKRDRCWRAHLVKNARQIHLGYFDSEKEAARVYDRAALQFFGSFAALNFPTKQNEQTVLCE